MDFSTRQAKPTDRDRLFELYTSLLKGYISEIWGWDESWQKDDFDSHFKPEHVQVVMVEEEIAGYLHIVLRDGASHIFMLCLASAYQNKGIGGALLESVVSETVSRGGIVQLKVFKINTNAKRFYERHGFRVCDENDTHYTLRRNA